MRVLRFLAPDGSSHLGLRRGDTVLDLGAHDTRALMHGPPPPAVAERPAADLRLDAPIRPGKLIALAGNFRAHIVESGFAPIEAQETITPQVFCKTPNTINRPGGAIAVRPANVFLDWEVELAVVIGRTVTDVRPEDAMAAVFGYTIVNDISERRFNSRVAPRKVREFDPFFDWLMGKWFDGSAPLGPEIVTPEEIGDPHDLPLQLWVNDALMQDGRTSQMIFRVPETIAYLSSVMTLDPGDVIAMGTPSGVGAARGIALQAGDRVRAAIEGIGLLETHVTGGGAGTGTQATPTDAEAAS